MVGGRSTDSFSLDRIDPTKGYIEGNIRVLPYGLNSSRPPLNACLVGINAGWFRIQSCTFGNETPF